MRLGPGLLYEGRTLQGARPKLADFCSATMAEFYSAVDTKGAQQLSQHLWPEFDKHIVSEEPGVIKNDETAVLEPLS